MGRDKEQLFDYMYIAILNRGFEKTNMIESYVRHGLEKSAPSKGASRTRTGTNREDRLANNIDPYPENRKCPQLQPSDRIRKRSLDTIAVRQGSQYVAL